MESEFYDRTSPLTNLNCETDLMIIVDRLLDAHEKLRTIFASNFLLGIGFGLILFVTSEVFIYNLFLKINSRF